MQTDTQDIRLRPDGSIDIAYYTDRSRVLRGEQAHRIGGGLLHWPTRLIAALLPQRLRSAPRPT